MKCGSTKYNWFLFLTNLKKKKDIENCDNCIEIGQNIICNKCQANQIMNSSGKKCVFCGSNCALCSESSKNKIFIYNFLKK